MGEEIKKEEGTIDPKVLTDVQDKLKKTMDKLEQLEVSNLKLMTEKDRLEERIDELKNSNKSAAKKEEVVDDGTLDQLTPSQLYKKLRGDIQNDLQVIGSELKALVGGTQQTVERDRVQRRVDEVVKSNPDFWDYKNEIHEIAKRNPNIDPEDAYLIAKSKKEKQSKVDTDKQEEEKRKAKENEKKTFSEKGGSVPIELSKDKPASSKDAAVSAWDEVMEGQEGV
jgi:hypothetical protein